MSLQNKTEAESAWYAQSLWLQVEIRYEARLRSYFERRRDSEPSDALQSLTFHRTPETTHMHTPMCAHMLSSLFPIQTRLSVNFVNMAERIEEQPSSLSPPYLPRRFPICFGRNEVTGKFLFC